ncbi:hypothetical protein DXG01_016985 [Tephrocybe rancida]|nr:hypothetical protein DXG01_016985 [Tephrocybe rancida]
MDDHLTFQLPPFTRHSRRFMAIYELWSPNTMRYSSYPRVLPLNYSYSPNPDKSKRFFDGQLGRFNYSMSPQVLQKDFIWHALIYRPRVGRSKGLPEFGLLYEQWVSLDAPTFTKQEGYLNAAYLNILGTQVSEIEQDVEQRCSFMENNYTYLWSTKPKKFLLTELNELQRATMYEDAMDKGAVLQRGMREMDAWIQLADALGSESWKSQVDKTRLHKIDLSDDDLLGCWINGSLEDNALLLLSLGAPCYVVHEMTGDGTPGTEMHEIQHSPNLGWFDKTDLEGMEPGKLTYEYDKIALQNGSPHKVHYSRLPRGLARGSLSERRHWSALSQGWLGLRIGRHLHPLPPPPLIPHKPNPKEEIDIDPATEACSQTKPLERICVFPDCVELIKPLPVLSVVASQGEWTKWEEMTDGSFICRGKGWQVEDNDAVIFYNRQNRRELVMNANKQPSKGVVSDMEAFGMPAPEDELPLDLELAAQALLNELQPMDVDEEDRISLGLDNGNLENEVVSTATKEAETMDVESPLLALKDAAEPVSKASSDTTSGE